MTIIKIYGQEKRMKYDVMVQDYGEMAGYLQFLEEMETKTKEKELNPKSLKCDRLIFRCNKS